MKKDLKFLRGMIKSCRCPEQLKNAYGIYKFYIAKNDCSQFPMILKSIEEMYQKTKNKIDGKQNYKQI